MISYKVWMKLGLAVLAVALLFVCVAKSQASERRVPVETATGSARVYLGGIGSVTTPPNAEFTSVEQVFFPDQGVYGVQINYTYPIPSPDVEIYTYTFVDICSITNGQTFPNYRKKRVGRIEVTDAFWDVTGRVEVGTFNVCAFTLTPNF